MKTGIFIRIPKTASTSLVSIFNKSGNVLYNKKHKFLPKPKMKYLGIESREALGEEIWNSHFKFAFVRNPYDRCVSSWKYTSPKISFKKFINNENNFPLTIMNNKYDFTTWHNCIQSNHVLDKDGNITLDYIGKFENLQEDFNVVCDSLEIDRVTLPKNKQTSHKHYTEYYDSTDIDRVYKIYKQDIDLFNYKFGE